MMRQGLASAVAHLLGRPKPAKQNEAAGNARQQHPSAPSRAAASDVKTRSAKPKEAKGSAGQQHPSAQSRGAASAVKTKPTTAADVEGEARGIELERTRCAAIMCCEAAANQREVAMYLAFETTMGEGEAIEMLARTAVDRSSRTTLAERMAGVRIPNPGVDGGDAPESDAPTGLAGAILRAGAKARGEIPTPLPGSAK